MTEEQLENNTEPLPEEKTEEPQAPEKNHREDDHVVFVGPKPFKMF